MVSFKERVSILFFASACCLVSVDSVNCQEQSGIETRSLKAAKSIHDVKPDLVIPKLEQHSAPAAGKRIKLTSAEYSGTNVYHTLYLPTSWTKDREKKYPVIVEYAGNGPYRSPRGDVCTGKVDDCKLGFGISAGKEFIWICMPYVSKDGKQNQLKWWGSRSATVDYCKRTVADVIERWNGDSTAVFLVGFSRGAIACNYIGLADDEIAKLWRGFLCHSHYDGVRDWNYP